MKSQQQIKQQQYDELMKLLAWIGSRARLAAELGETRQTVYAWVKRGRISASAARRVDEKTEGLFSKEMLRPDVVVWSVS